LVSGVKVVGKEIARFPNVIPLNDLMRDDGSLPELTYFLKDCGGFIQPHILFSRALELP